MNFFVLATDFVLSFKQSAALTLPEDGHQFQVVVLWKLGIEIQ